MFVRPAFAVRLVLAAAALGTGAAVAAAGELDALPCPGCQLVPDTAAPAELYGPPVDFDWSFGLRGGLVRDADGTRPEVLALPSVSLKQQTMRGGYSLAGSAELSATGSGDYRVDSATLDASGRYSLDEWTTANVTASIGTSQDAPSAPGLAANVASAPVVTAGEATTSLTRQIGALAGTLRLGVARTVHGETIYDDASTLDNSDQNTSDLSLGGRLAMPVTPLLSVFVDGDVTAEWYDAPSPSLLAKLDNRTYRGKVGVTASWGETLSFEGSIGLAQRDFLDDAVTDVSTVIYDASATYRPDNLLSVTADLSASLGAPDADCGCTADVNRSANVAASYLVNSWLRLRGSAGATQSGAAGSSPATSTWNAAVGLDYLFNAQTDFTADYTYSQSTTGSASPEDSQSLMLGVTVHR